MDDINSAIGLIREDEAAKMLGLRVATLRRWRWSGKEELCFYRIGGAIRYCPREIEKYKASCRRRSTSDPGTSASPLQ